MIRTVHVFQCGSVDLYGVTRDETGANLPTDECADGWRFIRTMEMEEGLPPRGMAVAWQERDAAVRAAIADHGFFIGEAVALPFEFNRLSSGAPTNTGKFDVTDDAPVSRREFEALEAEVIALALAIRVLAKRERQREPFDTNAILALFDQASENWPDTRRAIFAAARADLLSLLSEQANDGRSQS
jgi:hypothetical protein